MSESKPTWTISTNEFDAEFLSNTRKAISKSDPLVISKSLVLRMIDEIENNTRVRCTADGDFPDKNIQVMFEVDGDDTYIGGCFEYDLDCGSFWFGADDDNADFYPITERIYWIPMIDLKSQYEAQRGDK